MKKFFVTNLIFLLTLNVLIKSVWILGIDRGVQNLLPAEDYGLYYALLNFTYLFNIILDCGINSFNNRTIAQHNILLSKYFSKIIPLKFLLSLVYCVVLSLGCVIVGYDFAAMRLIFWLCILQILISLMTYLRTNVSALLLFRTDSILSVMDKFLTIVFCSFCLILPSLREHFTIMWFIYVQIVSVLITTLVALVVCLHKTGFLRLNWDKMFMISVLKSGLPYAILALLMSFYNRMDTVMLERILKDGGVQASIYASGFRLVDSVNMIAYLVSVILLPLFAKLIEEKKNVQEIVKISFHILLFLSVSFVLISLLYGENLMQIMYNKHVVESNHVYKILCFCFIPVSMTYIFGTLLTANGSLKQLNFVATAGMILNISINFLLIPHFEAIGSAFAALTAQTITALAQAIIALRVFHINFSWKYFFKVCFFIFVLCLVAILLYNICIAWYFRIIVSLFAFIVVAFLTNIFNIKEIQAYVLDFLRSKKQK